MMFLDFWSDPIGTIIDALGEIIGEIFNLIWLILCQLIYPMIANLFHIFTKISTLTWIQEANITDIINRITLILTIVMTFYIVFEFVKYTVSPDTIGDKEKGAMPLFGRIIISVILLAFVPDIFSYANRFQHIIIDNNVIGKVVLGVEDGGRSIEGLGREFTGDLFGSFIRVDCTDISESACNSKKQSVVAMINEVKNTNTFFTTAVLQFDLNVEFSGLLALIFGCFILYVVFLYCKDVALRHIQLLFLQVISPIAIISYIAPKKDGMFQKWVKQCLTTYLDLFIRVAVLYFMFLVCRILGDNLGLGNVHQAGDGSEAGITVYLFLITGLMLFLKKVPKLLQELFPSSGAASIGYGFSGKDRKVGVWDAGKQVVSKAAAAYGAIGGIRRAADGIRSGKLLSDLDKNKKTGKISKLRKLGTYGQVIGRSAIDGWNAGKNGKFRDGVIAGQKTAQGYEELVATGGTVLGHDYGAGHYQNEKARLKVEVDAKEKEIKKKETAASNYKSVRAAQDSAEEYIRKKIKAGDGKVKVSAQEAQSLTEKLNSKGQKLTKYGIKINDGDTTSQIYNKIVAHRNSLQSQTEANNSALITAQINKNAAIQERDAQTPKINTRISNTQKEMRTIRDNLTEARRNNDTKMIVKLEQEMETKRVQIMNDRQQLADLDLKVKIHDKTVRDLETAIKTNQIELAEFNDFEGKALKELGRHSYTVALQGGQTEDPGFVSSVRTSKVNLDIAWSQIESEIASRIQSEQAAHPELSITAIEAQVKSDIQRELGSVTLYEGTSQERKDVDIYTLLQERNDPNSVNQVTDFEKLDAIQAALTEREAKLNDEVTTVKDKVRKIQESDEWQQAEANTSGQN